MSVPKKMQEFAAVYGCEIVEKLSHDGYKLYAKDKDSNNEEFICRSYETRSVDLTTLRHVLLQVSGRTLAQFWTGREAIMDKLQQLREALEQQRKDERENWPFLNEENKPTGAGESITDHLAVLYQWSPGYVIHLPGEERDTYLQEVWRAFSIASDIISRYEKAAEALLKEQS